MLLLLCTQVDDTELHQIRLIGCIVDVSEHSTHTTYKIEDGSGRIDIKFFLDADSAVQVRILGSFRVQHVKIAQLRDRIFHAHAAANQRVWLRACISRFDIRDET